MEACTGYCATHGQLCEVDPDHDGDHECQDCPGYLRRERAEMIADRVAGIKALHESGFVTTPDED